MFTDISNPGGNSIFILLSLIVICFLFCYIRFILKRPFASVFVSIVFTIYTLFFSIGFWNFTSTEDWWIRLVRFIFFYCHCCFLFQFPIAIVSPKLRPMWFRICISWPGAWFVGVCFTAAMTSLMFNRLTLFAFHTFWRVNHEFTIWESMQSSGLYLDWTITIMSMVVAFIGLVQSLVSMQPTGQELVEIDCSSNASLKLSNQQASNGVERYEGLERAPFRIRSVPPSEQLQELSLHARNYLRIFQMTDVHLGPFMSVDRLSELCQRAVHLNPDLILITGDMDTNEARSNHDALQRALSPLKAAQGRTFACFGVCFLKCLKLTIFLKRIMIMNTMKSLDMQWNPMEFASWKMK